MILNKITKQEMKKENDREKITQRDKKNNVKWGKRKTKKQNDKRK